MKILTIRDADVAGKRVFVRVDFNVPIHHGVITDDSRIRATLPTITTLIDPGACLVLASHLGRPKGRPSPDLSLRPVAERLAELLGRPVHCTEDALGAETRAAIAALRPGDVLLLENLRFHPEEEQNDAGFAAELASYADIYVNDAFGTAHRAHASTVGIATLLPAYAGLLMEREIDALSGLLEAPRRPFAAILGGAKVSDKLKVIDNLLTKVDVLILGGGMANTFLAARGLPIGDSLAELDLVDDARRILAAADVAHVKVILPVDVRVAREATADSEFQTVAVDQVPGSWRIVDIGPNSERRILESLAGVRTVFWNGPVGVFEVAAFARGTRDVARMLADAADRGTTVVVGGGDSLAAIAAQGLSSRMTHLSTGGGASLEFLEGRVLPGIAVLEAQPTPV